MTLAAAARQLTGKAVATLREQNQVPAVLYGHGITAQNITVAMNDLDRVLRSAGESTLIDLAVDGGAAVPVLIHDAQYDAVKHQIIHVDFYQVNMKEKITTDIRLVFTGESAAVKGLGGTLVTSLEELEVRCLPTDLVSEITVDITPLATFEDKLTVANIVVPAGIEVLTDPEVTIATVAAPRAEEPVAAPAAEGEAAPAEGAAASADGGEAKAA